MLDGVCITGGEPLMRTDLERCGRAIYDRGFPWGMVTNGLALTRKRFDALLASGMHSATVSLDGLEEDHNNMRGNNNSFSAASNAIAMMASESDFVFDVVTCVTQRNIDKLDAIKEHLLSLGCTNWRLFTVFPAGRAASDPELQLSREQSTGLCPIYSEANYHLQLALRAIYYPPATLPLSTTLHIR